MSTLETGKLIAEIREQKKILKDISDEDKNREYLCLLEDASIKFHKKTIISYLILSIAILVYSMLFNDNIGQIIAIAISLFAITLYYFSISEYKTSIKRFGYYLDISEENNKIMTQIKYSNVFIGVSVATLFIITGISSINDIYINYRVINISYYTSYTIFSILGISMINLIIYYMINDKYSNKLSLKSNNKFKLLIISSITSVLTSIFLISYQLYRIIIANKNYDITMSNALIIGLTVFIFILNIVLLRIFIKENRLKYCGIVVSGVLQFEILMFSIYRNVTSGINTQSNVVGFIETGKIVITLLFVITIYHITNLIILRNESNCKIQRRK